MVNVRRSGLFASDRRPGSLASAREGLPSTYMITIQCGGVPFHILTSCKSSVLQSWLTYQCLRVGLRTSFTSTSGRFRWPNGSKTKALALPMSRFQTRSQMNRGGSPRRWFAAPWAPEEALPSARMQQLQLHSLSVITEE